MVPVGYTMSGGQLGMTVLVIVLVIGTLLKWASQDADKEKECQDCVTRDDPDEYCDCGGYPIVPRIDEDQFPQDQQ